MCIVQLDQGLRFPGVEYARSVIMNKAVFESDLAILIGHVLGNPYGGYSGGYKMAATGITVFTDWFGPGSYRKSSTPDRAICASPRL